MNNNTLLIKEKIEEAKVWLMQINSDINSNDEYFINKVKDVKNDLKRVYDEFKEKKDGVINFDVQIHKLDDINKQLRNYAFELKEKKEKKDIVKNINRNIYYYYDADTKEIIPEEKMREMSKNKSVPSSQKIKAVIINKEKLDNKIFNIDDELNTINDNNNFKLRTIEEFDNDWIKQRDNITSNNMPTENKKLENDFSNIFNTNKVNVAAKNKEDNPSKERFYNLLDQNKKDLDDIKKSIGNENYNNIYDSTINKLNPDLQNQETNNTVTKKSKFGEKIKAKFKSKVVKVTSLVLAATTLATMAYATNKNIQKKRQEKIDQNYISINNLSDAFSIIDNNITYYNGENDLDHYWLSNEGIAEDLLALGKENLPYTLSIVFSDSRFYENRNNRFHNLDRLCQSLNIDFNTFLSEINMTEDGFYEYGKNNRNKTNQNFEYNYETNEVIIRSESNGRR